MNTEMMESKGTRGFNSGSISAMVANDLKDLRRNVAILPILFIPPLLAYIMRQQAPATASPAQILPAWLVYSQVLVGMNIISLGLSEEKEKKTLEALMVTPVSPVEIISAKLLFATLVTLIVEVLTAAVAGGVSGNIPLTAAITLVGTAFFTLLGLIIGISSSNQKAAGAVSTPFMLLFLIPALLAQAWPAARKLAQVLPSYSLGELLNASMERAGSLAGHGKDIITLGIWIILAVGGSLWVLRKQGMS